MIRSERGDPCKHPVRPPIPNTCCWIRGRRAFESGNVEVVDKGIRGVFPVEDADDAAEGELVVGEEEAQAVDTLPTPYQPTQSERDDHELTHANYRSWCEHCVNGRGLEMKHAATTQEGRGIATVGFDYMFISGSSVYTRAEWSEANDGNADAGDVLKVLVVRDFKSKALFAHAVRCKGADVEGFAVQCIVDDCKWLGYSRIILKSDNERPIVRLLTEALKALRIENVVEQVMEEHPPPYDS